MSIILLIARILLGCLFIASAAFKLFPLEYFEVVLVDQTGLHWTWVPWFSRILIFFEAFIGLSLVFGFKLRWSLIASMAMLLVFTGYLVLQISMGQGDENCGCFGELIPLDGPSSVAKNGIMMLWAAMLFWKSRNRNQWKLPWLAPVLGGLSLIGLFIGFPLPSYSEDADFELDVELLDRADFEHPEHISEGRKVVVVMLANCVHCAQLAKLISTLDPQEVEDKLRIVVVGNTEAFEHFVGETGVQEFQVARSVDPELVAAVEGTFPTLILVDEGAVKSKWLGRDVNIRLLTESMKLD